MGLMSRRNRRRAARAAAGTRERRAGDYDSAMLAVRDAVAGLEALRRRHPANHAADHAGGHHAGHPVHRLHARIDAALASAAAAAREVYELCFAAAGGLHYGEIDPEVVLWKRRMNTALTLRSKHQLAQVDDQVGVFGSPYSTPLDVSRAAYGPHQAGLDFDEEPVRANRMPARAGT
jgi:hypothetical protein